MGIFYTVFATIVSFLVFKIQEEKKLHKQNSDSIETSNNNNTKSHNKDLVTTFISVGIFILATIAGLGGVLNSLLLRALSDYLVLIPGPSSSSINSFVRACDAFQSQQGLG